MFRKIVSNLAFSPALVGQLSFYAKRLKKEEVTRRIGLIFTALALVVQSFAVFSPPEAANAASPSDFIRGGISNLSEYVDHYDKNIGNIRDIMNYTGITRAEIVSAKKTTINSKDGWLSWGRVSPFSAAKGDVTHTYPKTGGGTGTVHSHPLWLWDSLEYTKKHGSTYTAWVGTSKKLGTFAIMKDCANLNTKRLPPPPPKPASACANLTVSKIERTRFTITASGKADNGATINGYTVTIKSKAGKTIATKNIPTAKNSATYTYDQALPGTYSASLVVATSLGNRQGANCNTTFTVDQPPAIPAAACSSLSVGITARTTVRMTGEAVVSGGATVSKYTFVIKDSGGKTVKELSVNSSELIATSDAFVVDNPGKYSATLTVATSLGNKTDTQNCAQPFTIVPPEMCAYNPSLAKNSPDCQPCPGDPSRWIKDEECVADVVNTKTAVNITRGNVNATTVSAHASDRIVYTITAQNSGLQTTTIDMKEQLGDVLEYAKLVDNGGGVFDQPSASLLWSNIQLKPGEKQSRVFAVQALETIPTTNQGQSNGSSYDCVMSNTFGNNIDISMDCPAPKEVEQIVTQLPKTGATENMIFAGITFAIIAYFYARARQVKKEVRLIRHEVNAGTI